MLSSYLLIIQCYPQIISPSYPHIFLSGWLVRGWGPADGWDQERPGHHGHSCWYNIYQQLSYYHNHNHIQNPKFWIEIVILEIVFFCNFSRKTLLKSLQGVWKTHFKVKLWTFTWKKSNRPLRKCEVRLEIK